MRVVWVLVVSGAIAGCSDDGGAGASSELDEPAPPLCRIELSCASEIPDEPKTDCRLTIHDGFGAMAYADRAGLERRGRSSQAYDKPNYGLELRTASGAENATNLLGMGQESDWILDGLWIDRALVRNELAFALFRGLEPERWAPRGRFCELSMNGEPRGIYRLGERIKRDDDRIDIPEDDGSGESFVVKQDSDGELEWDVGEERRWKLVSPNQERATDAQRRGVQTFFDQLDAALHDDDDELFGLLDLDAAVDFVITQELAKSADAYNLSLHLWRAPGAPAQLVPWDFDLSMGQPASTIRPGTDSPEGWVPHRTLLSDGLERRRAFRERLAERWRMHRTGPLSKDTVNALIDRALETLTPAAVDANFAIWPIEEIRFEPIYEAYSLYDIGSHTEEIARLRGWLMQRLAWMDANIARYRTED